ncbi:MAG: ABC transporter permease [Gemmatimonadaceae bacterium]
MPLYEAVRLALSQLRVQKLKSFFTLLGVMISVMFLIAVVSIVEGMGKYVEQDFAAKFLGVNTFNLRRYPDFNTDVTEAEWRAWQRRPRLLRADAEAVRDALPPEATWAMHDVTWAYGSSEFRSGGPQMMAHAVTPHYFNIKDLVIERGRAFTEVDNTMSAPVLVIGADVASHFFPSLDPVGRELRIRGFPFTVIGVLEKQGSVFGLNLDRQVIAPYESHMATITGRANLYGVVVQAPTAAELANSQEIVREVMRRRHGLRPAQGDDFSFETSESALKTWQSIRQFLVLAGIFLPAIGLVVGAIVIMNIMLVAVAERTREIGIRKSLGARRRDILAQFLVEAATLSMVGAAIGVGLGVALSQGIAAVSPLPATVALWSVIAAVVIGAGVGIVAGAYPASRASRLDPIYAMRQE